MIALALLLGGVAGFAAGFAFARLDDWIDGLERVEWHS